MRGSLAAVGSAVILLASLMAGMGTLLVALAAPAFAQEQSVDGTGSGATDRARDASEAGAETVLPPPPPGVEILVIKGQRRRGSVVEASQAATTFDAVELEALGVADIGDLAASTPSLEIRKAGSTTVTFFIRGVGLNDFTANASGSVAIYQDDVPLNLPALQGGLVYDVQDVQVLKGPQGAGPGRNASAGAIKTVSKKPTGEFSSMLRTDYGNYAFLDTEGVLEVPLVDDVLSTRMSVRLMQRDGYVKNRCGGLTQAQIDDPSLIGRKGEPGSPCGNRVGAIENPTIVPGLPRHLNDRDIWAARAHLRFVPPEIEMDWMLSVHGSRLDQVGTVGEPLGTAEFLGSNDLLSYQADEVAQEQAAIAASLPQPFSKPQCNRMKPEAAKEACLANREAIARQRQERLTQNLADRPLDSKPFEGDYNVDSFEKLTTYGGFLRGEWELPRASLLSISSFERYFRDRAIDADYTPNRLSEFTIVDDAWQFAQDLRASGELERHPVTWGAGGYYLMEVLDYSQTTSLEELANVDQSYRQESWSFGVYGDFSWEFMDDLTLDGGVRYNWERKRMNAIIFRSGKNACSPQLGGQFLPDCDVTATFGAPTGTLGITYDFNDQVSSYWKYSRGWKGPQMNARDGNPPLRVVDVAEPEVVDAFEVGFKGLWLDDRLRIDGAAFWYSYDNYQVFTTTNDVGSPSQRIVINANDAQIYGIELEMGLEPIDALQIDLRFGWLESKFLDFTDTGTRNLSDINTPDDQPLQGFSQVTIDYNGHRLPNAPRFKLSGSVTYTYDLGRYGSLIPRYDFNWIDDVFFDPSEGRGAPNLDDEIFLPPLTIGQEAYAIHSVRLTYQAPSGNFSIAGWVRNLGNEVYKVAAFDQTGNANQVTALLGLPRTYGVSARIDF